MSQRRAAVFAAAVVAVAAVGIGAGLALHPHQTAPPGAASASLRSITPGSGERSITPGSEERGIPAAAPALPPGGPVPAGFRMTSTTTTTGGVTYLLGSAPCRTPPCTSVVRLAGGRWRGVPAPRATLATKEPSSDSDTVRDLRFATPRDGWAFGGALWSTHDGGAHWRRIHLGGAVSDLASDGTTTYASVARCVATDCSSRLRATPAGRDDWRDVPGVSGQVGLQLSVGGGSATATSVDLLYVRRGATWTRIPGLCPNFPLATTSASSPRIFVLCADHGAGQVYLSVRYSDDAGRTWTNVAGDLLHLTNGPFITVTAASSSVLLAASGSPDYGGLAMVSRNGGRTWTTASRGGLPDLSGAARGGWRYVGASSATRLVALARVPQRNYWVTHDAGRTWQAVTPG